MSKSFGRTEADFQYLDFDEDFSDVVENESTKDNYSDNMCSVSIAASFEEEKEERKEFTYNEFKEYNPEQFCSTSEMLSLRTPPTWQRSELDCFKNRYKVEEFSEHLAGNESENPFVKDELYFVLSERAIDDVSRFS